MLSGEKIKADAVISDVIQFLGDEELRLRSLGWYREKLQRVIEKLATEYFLFVDWVDGEFKDMPRKLAMPVPDNFINPIRMYVYNEGCCAPGNDQRIVHYKPNFITGPGGTNYSANNHENQGYDPYYQPYFGPVYDMTSTFWANMEGGYLMFSKSCDGFLRYRIIYNTFGSKLSEVPDVPREYRAVVTHLLMRDCSMMLMRHDPKTYTGLMQAAMVMLNDPKTGSWDAFHRNAVSMSQWMRDDMNERQFNAKWYK